MFHLTSTFSSIRFSFPQSPAGVMAILLHISARVLLRRINFRPPQSFSKTSQRRKTSASGEKHFEKAQQPETKGSKPDAVVTKAPNGTTKLPLLQRLGPLTTAANAYDRIQKRRPWATQLCTSLVIYLCGDMLAQYIDGEDYNPLRTLRHLTIGAGASIPGYTWYALVPQNLPNNNTDQFHRFMYLNRHFNYPSHLLSLATKVFVNQTVFTPIFNSYFFAMQSLLAGATFTEAWERVKNTVPTSFYNSCKLWPAVTAFSFTYILPQYRFLLAGGVAVGWQSYLSWLNQRAAEEENSLL